MSWLKTALRDLLPSNPYGAKTHRACLWGSWGNLSRTQYEELLAAGCTEVIFNCNDVTGGGRRWDWIGGGRSGVLRRMATAAEAGMAVSVMPWAWAYPDWAQMCGKEVMALERDHGAPFHQLQLDWEGHAEVSAKRLLRGGRSMVEVVDACMKALCRQLTRKVRLGLTTLYFRRPGGDALMRWRWAHPKTGHLWTISEHDVQTYGVWLTGNSRKARSTHTPQFQPPGLVYQGWNNHNPFNRYLEARRVGFPLWALERLGNSVPARMRMTAAQALDAHIEAALHVGADGINGWAAHLMHRSTATHKRRFALALKAYERFTQAGRRVWTPARRQDPPGMTIHWDTARTIPALAKGGMPDGYRLPRQAGVSPAGLGPLGTAVLRRWRELEIDELGWVVEATYRGRRWAVVVQHHPYTFNAAGDKVPHNGPGATVGAEVAALRRAA